MDEISADRFKSNTRWKFSGETLCASVMRYVCSEDAVNRVGNGAFGTKVPPQRVVLQRSSEVLHLSSSVKPRQGVVGRD